MPRRNMLMSMDSWLLPRAFQCQRIFIYAMNHSYHSHQISPAGMSLLNRRSFLKNSSTALGSMALAGLLADDGLLGTPIRPKIRADQPYAPVKPFPRQGKTGASDLLHRCGESCRHLRLQTGTLQKARHPTTRSHQYLSGRKRQPHPASLGFQTPGEIVER